MTTKLKASILCLAAVTMFLLLPSCGGKPANPSVGGVCKLLCDESIENILDQEIEVFEYSYPKANVLPKYVNEKAALDSLLDGKIDLIVSYRDLTAKQKAYLKSKNRAYRSRAIAIDGVALIVNNANDIDELSMAELKELFTGESAKWGQLTPTALKNEDISVVFDGNSSGVLHYIQDKFNGGKELSIKYFAQKSTSDVFKAVQAHRNAIGVVSVSWLTDDLKGSNESIEQKYARLKDQQQQPQSMEFTDKVKVLKVRADDQLNGKKPYQAYIFDGSYPLFRKIFAIDASVLGTHEHDFFVFLTGPIGQKIILHTGIVPAAEPVRVVEVQ